MSIFEGIMLACFGFAWPVSILKTYRSKTTKGRSLLFQFVLLTGYLSGIVHKILFSLDIVLVLYCINFAMICIDTSLLLYYRKHKDVVA
ncbi:MAG: hypothetical protein GXY60_07190 [Spirochaetales bacterium]|nr:hypothetical protein [Spirochaetales bacterium]